MPKASVTRHIEREKQKLIDFVLDIEKYPEFIPFCIDSKVYEREDKKDEIAIIADLTIGRKPFVDTYKSDVRYDKKNDSIHVTNICGPLKHLQNKWKFTQKRFRVANLAAGRFRARWCRRLSSVNESLGIKA